VPTSSQYVTGVGGTLIPDSEFSATYWGNTNGANGGSALGYIPEQPWNDALEFAIFCEANKSNTFCSNNGVGNGPLLTDWDTMQENVIGLSAGGGVSNCVTVDASGVCTGGFPQPSWQAELNASAINPNGFGQVGSALTRFSPDVSLLASANWPGYLICTQLSSSGNDSSCDSPTTGISDMLIEGSPSTALCRSSFPFDISRVVHEVFQQHTRDPFRRQPVTDFRAFKIDGKNLIAPAGKHYHRSAGILSLRRVDCHRRPRYVLHLNPRPAGNQRVLTRRRRDLWPCRRLGIRHCPRPYRHLRMSRRWLPGRRLRAQTGRSKPKHEHNAESKDQRLHHNPHN
jgi:hypothetical protein